MRIAVLGCLIGLSALAVTAGRASAQDRPRVALTVVTLDQLRLGQERYARATLAELGEPGRGAFEWVAEDLGPALARDCADDRMDYRLDYCVRFYLTRAERPAGGRPTVVVVLDDDSAEGGRRSRGEELRVSCFGRGVTPADASAQDTWMWPGAERMHGMRDLDRDRDALAACISAAASETWTGLRQPDPPAD